MTVISSRRKKLHNFRSSKVKSIKTEVFCAKKRPKWKERRTKRRPKRGGESPERWRERDGQNPQRKKRQGVHLSQGRERVRCRGESENQKKNREGRKKKKKEKMVLFVEERGKMSRSKEDANEGSLKKKCSKGSRGCFRREK